MNYKLRAWIVSYRFADFYRTENQWQDDFKIFCEELAKKRIELSRE